MAIEFTAPADNSQTNATAIAMPSRSIVLLTGTGLTWDRNRVLLPIASGDPPPDSASTELLGKGACYPELHASRE